MECKFPFRPSWYSLTTFFLHIKSTLNNPIYGLNIRYTMQEKLNNHIPFFNNNYNHISLPIFALYVFIPTPPLRPPPPNGCWHWNPLILNVKRSHIFVFQKLKPHFKIITHGEKTFLSHFHQMLVFKHKWSILQHNWPYITCKHHWRDLYNMSFKCFI